MLMVTLKRTTLTVTLKAVLLLEQVARKVGALVEQAQEQVRQAQGKPQKQRITADTTQRLDAQMDLAHLQLMLKK
jgi:hypothetical protein